MQRAHSSTPVPAVKVRIDKWLWAARFLKTRSLATDAVSSGKIRCNDEKIKPAHGVKVGDVLTLNVGLDAWVVVVKALSEKRGSATVAQALYEETPDSLLQRKQQAENRKRMKDPAADLAARPTKRDRRMLEDFRFNPE